MNNHPILKGVIAQMLVPLSLDDCCGAPVRFQAQPRPHFVIQQQQQRQHWKWEAVLKDFSWTGPTFLLSLSSAMFAYSLAIL